MQKALTTLALVLVCFAAASATYYYGKYLPHMHDAESAERHRKTDLENAQRCNQDASKFYDGYRKDQSSGSPELDWYAPEMHFNMTLNTCLVEIRSRQFIRPAIAGADSYFIFSQGVTDIYSNREIIHTSYTDQGGEKRLSFGDGMDPKKYSAEKDKLFSE
jgi:hypothetical protein